MRQRVFRFCSLNEPSLVLGSIWCIWRSRALGCARALPAAQRAEPKPRQRKYPLEAQAVLLLQNSNGPSCRRHANA
jgi:hypothetical protein